MTNVLLTATKSIPLDTPEAWRLLSGATDEEHISPRQYFRAVPFLFRGVELAAGAVASMPFVIYRGKSEYDTSEDYQNKLGFLPKPHELFWMLEACLMLEPTAYLFSDNVGEMRKRLRYIRPDGATPVIDPVKGLTHFERYVNSQKHNFAPGQDIVYFWRPDPYAEQFTPGNSSPGKAALAASGVLANVDEFVSGYFKRGAIKATLLGVKGNPSHEERSKLEAWWNDFMSGLRNVGRGKVVNADAISATVVGDGLEGLQKNDLTDSKRQDIAAALGIPYTMLFSGSASGIGGGGVSEEDTKRFYDNRVVPDCRLIEGVLNEQVFAPLGYRLAFTEENLDIYQEDEEQRAQAVSHFVDFLIKCPTLGVFEATCATFGYELSPEMAAAAAEYYAKKAEDAERIAAQTEAQPTTGNTPDRPQDEDDEAERAELRRWQTKAIKRLKDGKGAGAPFESDVLDPALMGAIAEGLDGCETAEQVKAVFDDPWRGYP
jgi:phage portal protein BeeE